MSRSPAPANRRNVDGALPAHTLPRDAILEALGSARDGLSSAEAAARLERWGRNVIPEAAGPGLWLVFVRQFASPLIYVLVFAAAFSVWLGEWSDAGFIALVLLLNAAIGAAQEHRAERSAQALRSLVTTRADVVRDGDVIEVDARELVVGDAVLLSSGGKVPADVRLLDTHDLRVDESMLTGESLPVSKRADEEIREDAPLGDRKTMAYAGTLVGHGRGRGVVTATGADTVVGGLAEELWEPSFAEAPLLTRMRRFTMVVGVVVLLGAAAMGAIELSRGTVWHEVVLVAVALAVAAIPEGLPVALTVALAVAVRRMARRQVIVRRLVAIESLGSCTVIGSDKTGTLTVNELTVTHVGVPGREPFDVTGVGVDPTGTVLVSDADEDAAFAAVERLARAGVMCNEATLAATSDGWVHRGDPVDVALLVLGHKLGLTQPVVLEAGPQLDTIPFESERGYAATLHSLGGTGARIVVKGATERVLRMCTAVAGPDGVGPIDAEAVSTVAEKMSAQGERVLAVAVRDLERADVEELDHDRLYGMTLLGLIGMSDPLRADSPAAVAACQSAGIRVLMITGDHPATALAIARQLGLATHPAEVVTGAQLHAASQSEREALVADARVFARVEPAQKLEIVESLTRLGEIVAVTGDGANDAPALHHAHVGVAMGRKGTDVAREAAEIVVTDDRFGSIAAGVEEGRVAYGNVRKVIQLLISTGAAELLVVLVGLVLGLPLPLLAVQLLWLNLVTNGIQDVALAFEPGEGDEMHRRPRRPSEPIFNHLMVQRVLVSGVVMAGLTLGLYHYLLDAGWSVASARNSAVLLLVLFENVHVFNSRSETRSAFRHSPLRNPLLLGGTVAAQLLHVGAMHLPLTQSLLGLQPVSFGHWAVLLGLALTLLAVVEIDKALWRARARRDQTARSPSEPSGR